MVDQDVDVGLPTIKREVLARLEFRGLKEARFASHETPCYEATLYLDGVSLGKVSNDGQGGQDIVGRDVPEKLNALQPGADWEWVLACALDRALVARDLRRLLSRKVKP